MLGNRLQKLRKSKHMTQTDLANIVNVSKASISAYENDTRSPDIETLLLLADTLDVNSDYLLGRTDNPDLVDKKEFNPLEEINELIKKYGMEKSGFFDVDSWKKISKDDIKELENYFRYVVSKAKENEEDN